MKSILFLIPCLGGGGAERVLVNLANNLDKTKYEVIVQTIFDVGVNKEYLSKDVKYIGGFKKRFKGNSQIFKLFTPSFLYRKIIKKRYDIVVSYLEGVACRIVSGCPYRDSKLVAWIHPEQKNKKTAAYSFRSINEMNKCYNRFSKVACVAQTVKNDFEKLVDLKKPAIVLYNTNETDLIREKAREDLEDFKFSTQTNVVSVGRLINEKGYDRLLNVHSKLLKEGINHQLYILGTGALEGDLKAQSKVLGIEDSVHFLGFKKNPYKYVANADLFVCSSRREGFSTAVTESLVVGTPVISTNCSGANELLGYNNEYGIVVGQSEEELYDAMKLLLLDKEKLAQYKQKAVERGYSFSKEKTVQAVEEFLDDLFVK